jgi:hypothetical protein
MKFLIWLVTVIVKLASDRLVIWNNHCLFKQHTSFMRIFFFFFWLYSPRWTLTSSTIVLHCSQSC